MGERSEQRRSLRFQRLTGRHGRRVATVEDDPGCTTKTLS
jgi:hypothetical protein